MEQAIAGAEASTRGESGPLLARLAGAMATLTLDCGCREKVVEAIGRFSDLERLRDHRRQLADARLQVTRILGLLDLLRELDDIGVNEADATVFSEIAHVFADVADAARRGAADMRRLGEERERAGRPEHVLVIAPP